MSTNPPPYTDPAPLASESDPKAQHGAESYPQDKPETEAATGSGPETVDYGDELPESDSDGPLFDVSPERVLAPQAPGVGIFREHVGEKERSLEMVKQGKWYGYSSWDVRDAQGEVVLKGDLTRGFMSSKKLIVDAAGRELYTISSKFLSLGMTYVGISTDGTERELFRIRGPASCFSCGIKLRISLTNTLTPETLPIELILRTDRRGNGLLHIDGQEGDDARALAVVEWLRERKSMEGKKSGYRARVAPGVDVALVAGIVMGLHGVRMQRQAGTNAVVVTS